MISKDFQPRRWRLPTRLTRRIAFVLLPSPRQLSSYGSDMEDLVSWRKWWHHFKWWLNRHNPPKMNVKHFGFISTYPIMETQVDQLIAIFLSGRKWWASLMIMWIYVSWVTEVSASWKVDPNGKCYKLLHIGAVTYEVSRNYQRACAQGSDLRKEVTLMHTAPVGVSFAGNSSYQRIDGAEKVDWKTGRKTCRNMMHYIVDHCRRNSFVLRQHLDFRTSSIPPLLSVS